MGGLAFYSGLKIKSWNKNIRNRVRVKSKIELKKIIVLVDVYVF